MSSIVYVCICRKAPAFSIVAECIADMKSDQDVFDSTTVRQLHSKLEQQMLVAPASMTVAPYDTFQLNAHLKTTTLRTINAYYAVVTREHGGSSNSTNGEQATLLLSSSASRNSTLAAFLQELQQDCEHIMNSQHTHLSARTLQQSIGLKVEAYNSRIADRNFIRNTQLKPMRVFENNDKASQLNQKVEHVKSSLKENIERTLDRGEQLDDIVLASDDLENSSAHFAQQARRIKRRFFWLSLRSTIMIIVVCLIVALLIAMSKCGMAFDHC